MGIYTKEPSVKTAELRQAKNCQYKAQLSRDTFLPVPDVLLRLRRLSRKQCPFRLIWRDKWWRRKRCQKPRRPQRRRPALPALSAEYPAFRKFSKVRRRLRPDFSARLSVWAPSSNTNPDNQSFHKKVWPRKARSSSAKTQRLSAAIPATIPVRLFARNQPNNIFIQSFGSRIGGNIGYKAVFILIAAFVGDFRFSLTIL